MTIDNNDISKGGKQISNGVKQYTIIIDIRISSKFRNTTTNFPGVFHEHDKKPQHKPFIGDLYPTSGIWEPILILSHKVYVLRNWSCHG